MEVASATVTVIFECGAKVVPHLEERLREITHSTPCVLAVVEVSTVPIPTLTEEVNVEQVLEQGHGALEADGGRGGLEQGDGVNPVDSDAGEDGELAWTSGESGSEQVGGDSGAGLDGPVSGEASRDVTNS